MNTKELQNLFDAFNNLNVMIVGDVMIDSYMWGSVDRISPEAPVPVVAVDSRENRLGGAANVALNIQSLGANPIIHALIGEDDKGSELIKLAEAQKLPTNGIITHPSRQTTVKTRIISGSNQMLRVDEENTQNLSEEQENIFLKSIISTLKSSNIDIIIFEDYDKGLITEKVISETIKTAIELSIPTAVDPKKKNFNFYQGVSLFKPNLKELKQGLKIDFDQGNLQQIENAAKDLKMKLNAETVLVTLSELGIHINGCNAQETIPAHYRDITDVSGAGDTVISIAALCYALKVQGKELAMLSNLAGGLVCEKTGVVPIDKNTLLSEAKNIFSKN